MSKKASILFFCINAMCVYSQEKKDSIPLQQNTEYKIEPLKQVNTKKSEFGAVPYLNGIAFVTDQPKDLVNYNDKDVNGVPYTDIYTADSGIHSPSDVKWLESALNGPFHDGPICLDKAQNRLFLTRVEYINKRQKSFTNRSALFIFEKKDNAWHFAAPFKYNHESYSVGHAALSNDGHYLFFSSDMPGGHGGKDLYSCKNNGSGWDEPVNLGAGINTAGNEEYPFLRDDGILFFSSDGLKGYGGFDIFSAYRQDQKWYLNRNEGPVINSKDNDYAMVFSSPSGGYFTSNREGGAGKDDIYKFSHTSKTIPVSGRILLTENINDPAKGVKVMLKDDAGNLLGTTVTDGDGFFEFKNLSADKNYMAVIESPDPQLAGKARYYLADKNNVIQRVSKKRGAEKFVFKNLPLDANSLPELYSEDELTLAGNILYGENPARPLKDATLVLKNEFGDVIVKTKTNSFGGFAFRNIPADQDYLVSIEESGIALAANTKMTITNKKGVVLKTFYWANKKFDFKILASEKTMLKEMAVEDSELVMRILGYVYDENKKPVANARILLHEDSIPGNDKEIRTASDGRFDFVNLKADKNYIFEINDKDSILTHIRRIYLADSKGRIYKVLCRDGKGRFLFKFLEADKSALGEYAVDDPWLAVLELKNKKEQLTIIENIYYDYGSYKFNDAGQKVLDKVIAIMSSNQQLQIELSSHTDSRSSDQFNMSLSVKRAEFAVNYMISKGIDKKRLKAVGYGETRLLNRCANNSNCSEEEHALNRRTEFKITSLE